MVPSPQNDGRWTNIATLGSAQHGKSTLTGFLLWALGEVHTRVMTEAEGAARARGDLSRKFAFLLDRTPHERTTATGTGRAQTRQTSWWGFERHARHYLLMDNPGHFTRLHYVIGALSQADAAVLVVDTHNYLTALGQQGVWQENRTGQVIPNTITQVRAYLAVARFYGIEQLVVALHKMDLVGFQEERFQQVQTHLVEMLRQLQWDMSKVDFVPTAVQAVEERGFNVSECHQALAWYTGPTFVQALEQLQPRPLPVETNFRMQVNQVYQGKRVRVPGYELVITGKVLTGRIKVKDALLLQPSGVQCRVRSLQLIDNSRAVRRENRWRSPLHAQAGDLVGLGCTVTNPGRLSSVSPGEMAGPVHPPLPTGIRFRAHLIVLHLPALTELLTRRVAGTFGMGYFYTGVTVEQVGLNGIWKAIKSGRNKDGAEATTLRIADIIHPEVGNTLCVELALAKLAPLDVYRPGTDLGRFVLFSTYSFLICGGQITELLG